MGNGPGEIRKNSGKSVVYFRDVRGRSRSTSTGYGRYFVLFLQLCHEKNFQVRSFIVLFVLTCDIFILVLFVYLDFFYEYATIVYKISSKAQKLFNVIFTYFFGKWNCLKNIFSYLTLDILMIWLFLLLYWFIYIWSFENLHFDEFIYFFECDYLAAF